MAVDWRRIAGWAAPTGDEPAATSMVPPGIPGRSDGDSCPTHDPDGARTLLAEAGYPGRRGLPGDRPCMTGGGSFDAAIVDELKRELGITSATRPWTSSDYYSRLDADPPAMWSLGWVADYPGRNDFLGVLLGRGSTNDYGRWHSTELRCRDRRGRGRHRRGGRDRRLRPGRVDRPRGRAGLADRRTARAGRSRGTACSAPARTASGISGWRGSHGRTDAHGAGTALVVRPRPVAVLAVAGGRACRWPAWCAPPIRRPSGRRTSTRSFGEDIVFTPAGHAEQPARPRRAAGHVRGRARPDVVAVGRRRVGTGAQTLTYT